MAEPINKILPESVLNLKDVDTLRAIRQWADDAVQERKKEKMEDDIDKYRPIYEGKYLVTHGHAWNGPISVPNVNDTYIAKIHKIEFVGRGFFRCSATVLHIVYGGVSDKLDHSLSASDFNEVSIATYRDNSYDVDYTKSPVFMDEKTVKATVRKAGGSIEKAVNWFFVDSEDRD